MNSNPHVSPSSSAPLLGPGDPPPFEIINGNGKAQLLLVADHASRQIPHNLANLGLATSEFDRHIAYDIGTEAVTRILSKKLNAPAVIAGYSRMVLDLNRPPGHPDSIPLISDGTLIPANQNLTELEKDRRISELHDPYHEAISHMIAHIWNRGSAPVLFSVHSFTPNYGDDERPWDAGILWKRDPRIAVPIMDMFKSRGLNVGDNKPYSAHDLAYTVDAHATAAGLASCGLEIRQDQVSDTFGIERWSKILIEDLSVILTQDRLYESREY